MTSLLFIPGVRSPATVPRWILLAVALPFLIRKPRLTLELFLLILWLCLASASISWTPDHWFGLNVLFQLTVFAGAFLLGTQWKDMWGFYSALALGLLASSVLVVGQMLGWSPVVQGISPAGLFVNKNFIAECGILAIIGLSWDKRWELVAFLSPTVLATDCRAAFAAAGLVGLGKLGLKWPKMAIFLALSAIGGAFLIFPAATLLQRTTMWNESLAHLSLFGHGAGSFYVLFPSFNAHLDIFSSRPVWPHSEIINALFEYGLLSAIPFGFFALLLCGPGEGREKAVLLGGLTLCLFSFPLHLPVETLILGVVSGSLASKRPELLHLLWSGGSLPQHGLEANGLWKEPRSVGKGRYARPF